MRFLLSITLSLLLLPARSSAQSGTTSFQFPTPAKPAVPSRYSNLRILDLRGDTTSLGTLQTGSWPGSQKTILVAEKGLPSHIQYLFQSLAAAPSDSGSLLLILRRFAFLESATPNFDWGEVTLKAALFAKEPTGNYRLLFQTDSTLSRNYRRAGTNRISKEGAALFTSFLAHSLSQLPAGETVYTEANLRNTDSLLKAELPLFERETLAEGLYLTWESFAQQQPDHQIKAQAGNGTVMNVKTVDKKPKRKFGYDEMYALVHKGIPYIATAFGYYKLKKAGTDWTFTGRMREDTTPRAMLAGSIVGGAIGMAAVAESATTTYEMRLNPTGGRFIKLREVKGYR